MIITRLSGGIGNQMFQYAMGRALALRNETELRLDTSSYELRREGAAQRAFGLQHFAVRAPVATPGDYATLSIPDLRNTSLLARAIRKWQETLDRLLPLRKRRIVIERGYVFSPNAFSAGPDCLLIGVWQSPKYFSDAEAVIRREFTLASPLSAGGAAMLERIKAAPSVSVHVRRGDYAGNAKTNAKHGTCPPEYYASAIMHVTKAVANPRFFIFSDDIEWAKKNLNLPQETVFVPEAIPDYEALVLMSACTHHILANSTFSWWAAWLNASPDAVVIVPKLWFASGTSAEDLISANWLRL